jgi:hypothetical protein
MKVADSRHLKRERLRSGIALVLERRLDLGTQDARDELARFLLREHQLARVLAVRYGECVRTALQGFPEGDAPEDVLESHVDALCFHDETYARKLFPTDDHVVRLLRGTAVCVRRLYQWLDEGDLFSLGGRTFRVTAVAREKVGSVGEPEARREGTSLAEWRRSWVDNLPRGSGHDSWNAEQLCVRHDFVATDDVEPKR